MGRPCSQRSRGGASTSTWQRPSAKGHTRSCTACSFNKDDPLANVSRRAYLAAFLTLSSQYSVPNAAQASVAGFQLPWSSFGKVQPGPVRLPRKQLVLNFAVLLMRSTYEAVDALDFIAMDQFQIRFFKLRQSEFEPYKFLVDPLQIPIGNLASPIYFDFIAFSQYQTLSKAIPDAPQVFQEFCENCEGEALERPYRVVKRDAALADNKKLPERLQLQVGRTIIGYLREGFRGETFGCPAPLPGTASMQELADAVQQLLAVFVKNGFAIRARVENVQARSGGGGLWTVVVEGGANLWGLQTLQFRNALVTDAFDAFAILAYLEECGFRGKFEIDADGSLAEQSWSIRPV
eukprot:jgi/Ulvmu1/2617/UM014_0068.1